MPKRRKNKSGMRKNKGDDEDSDPATTLEPDPTSEEYFNDEIEQYHLKKDKILLDDEIVSEDESSNEYLEENDEVLQLDEDQSSDDDDDDAEDDEVESGSDQDQDGFMNGDDEDDDDDNTDDEESGLPSTKAWGKKKNQFYSSDVKDVDQFVDEEEELAAEEEEKEALSLQQRIMSELNPEDFDHFDLEAKPSEEKEVIDIDEDDSHVTKDLSKLSREEKLQILLKEAPELFALLDDYQEKMSEVINKYHPLLQLAKNGSEISDEGKEFIAIMHQLLLNYCVNINFYLALKANNENVKDHPVIGKLVEYRGLISKLEPVAKKLEDEMKELLEKAPENEASEDQNSKNVKDNKDVQIVSKLAKSVDSVLSKKKKKRKKTENPVDKTTKSAKANIDPLDYYEKIASEIKAKKMKRTSREDADNFDDDDNASDKDDDNSKRAITYEMAKNKGLTRKRKKELSNPRVKHKMKFKKAVVKRKSQIPQMRNEAGNYGGELTGIKANVAKSVKIR